MTEALDRLIEAVEGPASIRRSWASDVFERKHLARYVDFAANGGSLDAAKALHEALLPGWVFDVSNDSAFVCPQEYMTFDELPDHIRQFAAESEHPARSWLLAILKAHRARIGGDG